jgi:hypothetical protein
VCEVKDLAACLNAKNDNGHHQDIKHHMLSSGFHNFLEVIASLGNGPNLL